VRIYADLIWNTSK